MGLSLRTKMKIAKPATDVFEAFVNPENMAHYWFTSGSGRWEQGKTITLRYEEYNAQLDITILEIEENKKIVYQWGGAGEQTVVTIAFDEAADATTIVDVSEDGWKENDPALLDKLLGNKEGWVYVLTCLKGFLEYGVSLRGALVK
ncbi:SRPBCC family protein [Brevibacillus fluminis]|nr:SRPBCC family protein [Brevibacillus fluminis]